MGLTQEHPGFMLLRVWLGLSGPVLALRWSVPIEFPFIWRWQGWFDPLGCLYLLLLQRPVEVVSRHWHCSAWEHLHSSALCGWASLPLIPTPCDVQQVLPSCFWNLSHLKLLKCSEVIFPRLVWYPGNWMEIQHHSAEQSKALYKAQCQGVLTA